MGGELPGESFVSDVSLGDDKQAGSILVDPVDDARPSNAPDTGQPAGTVVKQRVHKCPVEIARGRVDDQSRRFVHHQQMLVFENDLERNVLRLIVRGLRLRNSEAEIFIPADFRGRVAKGFARSLDSAAPNENSSAVLGKGWHCRSKRAVEAPTRVGRLQANIDRLTTPHE